MLWVGSVVETLVGPKNLRPGWQCRAWGASVDEAYQYPSRCVPGGIAAWWVGSVVEALVGPEGMRTLVHVQHGEWCRCGHSFVVDSRMDAG